MSGKGFLRLVAGIAFCALVCANGCRQRERSQPSLQNAWASLQSRSIELRLTGLPYVPKRPITRGESSEDLAAKAASYAALSSSNAKPSTRALAFLLLDRPAEASAALKPATVASTASVWNDLAVTLHQQGIADANTRTVAEALAATDAALRLAPRMAEAHFNRAAILQHLGWREAAAQEWDRYLHIDNASGWADEARARRALLRSLTIHQQWPKSRSQLEQASEERRFDEVGRIVRTFPQHTRATAEVEDLANWATQYRKGEHAEAARTLARVRAVANALLVVNGEQLLHDSVTAIDAHPDLLARAHVRYREARLLIQRREISTALPAITEAETMFLSGESPMALVARYYRAGILFDLNRPAEAQALLENITDTALPRYDALHAQVLWEESWRALRRGEAYASLAPNEDALAIFERLGERDNAIRVLANRASTLSLLGRDDEAWQMRTRLFALAGESGRPDSVESTLHGSGFAAVQEGRFDVAHSLFTLLLTSDAQSPVRRFDAALLRTLAAARMGIGSTAELDDLATIVESLPDDSLKEDGRDELNYVAALFDRVRDPEAAVSAFSRSIEHRERRQLLTLAETYAARGEAYRLAGNTEKAALDLQHALSLLEQQRSAIDEDPLRDSFFASADSICASLSDVELGNGRNRQAFAAAERCRGRALGDVLATRQRSEPISADRIRAILDPSTVLLHFNVREDRIITFVLRHDGMTAHTQRTSRKLDSASNDLYSLLIEPIERTLSSARTLIIVPDETLASTPFAALRSRSGRYLIEDHEIAIVPSATWYAESARGAQVRRGAPNVGIVADPAFDATVVGNLERLPGARREAAALSAIYPQATTLIDHEATPRRFFDLLRTSDLVHVGSHAIISTRDASHSVLVLAPDQNSGLVSLANIRDQKLPRRPLIILAGCKSAVDGVGKGTVRSLAFAFLAAGARGVIGSVRNVDDAATHALTTEFHRRMNEGLPPGAALRAAQLHLLRSSDQSLRDVHAWGAFQFYGFDQ